MLDEVDPGAFIATAVHISVDAISIGLVISKVADVNVTAGVPEGAHAFGLVSAPEALVNGAIGPFLNPEPAALRGITDYLAFVNAAVRQIEVFNINEPSNVLPEIMFYLFVVLLECIALVDPLSRSKVFT